MSLNKSIYEEIIIESRDGKRTVDIAPGVIMLDYFEDIFSPTITARLVVVNTGNTIMGQDGKLQSIYHGLPLRGGERVSIKVGGNCDSNPGLDFASDETRYFYVSSITTILQSTEQESFTLNLVSREAITNETVRVGKKYPTSYKISDSVQSIIKEKLKTSKPIFADETQNKYGFISNMRKPFTLLTWLASKSVPSIAGGKDATAGYVFYETKSGYHFRSIDKLIASDPFPEKYLYTEVKKMDVANDYKILKYTTAKNEDLMEKLQRGAYCSQRTFFNPLDFTYTSPSDGKFQLKDYQSKTQNLGNDIQLPSLDDDSDKNLGEVASRNITAILDIGAMEIGVSTDENADPAKVQSQSMMRYNSIFTQTISMTVPSNTNLEAGNLIECKFPKVNKDDTKGNDLEQSGLYMIKELCHHFDSTVSLTSMTLIKDTFGQPEN
tara:strand:+ start:8572 stop:9885 length:1314 start_codon:yes stop_codon:yes gene_type:complete